MENENEIQDGVNRVGRFIRKYAVALSLLNLAIVFVGALYINHATDDRARLDEQKMDRMTHIYLWMQDRNVFEAITMFALQNNLVCQNEAEKEACAMEWVGYREVSWHAAYQCSVPIEKLNQQVNEWKLAPPQAFKQNKLEYLRASTTFCDAQKLNVDRMQAPR